jgi:hypothetical protein
MKRFIEKHKDKIAGTLECFDRILLKGYLPFPTGRAMEAFLDRHGILYKDFKRFVLRCSARVKDHARAMAERHGRPFEPIHPRERKEDHARRIAERDGITSGLVCVFTAVETCSSFVLRPGKGKPRLHRARRKCLHLYFYFMDRHFGLIHVRLQTWFPFMVQVCLNGHEWLARKLDRHGVAYERIENAFMSVGDLRRAQRFADAMLRKNWLPVLETIARRVNPLLKDLLAGAKHYWVIEQAEFATDLLFKDRATLKELYRALARHASLCFSAEDLMGFLGRKLHGAFQGEVQTDVRKRHLGLRIRHVMAGNVLKMYDKHGLILRIETVINRPREFKIFREGTRRGERILGWFPMAKRIANLKRYAEVSRRANHRYLQALSVVDDPSGAYGALRRLCRPVSYKTRRRRGLNPLRPDDAELFGAVLRGEHAIKGFSNRSLRRHLYRSKAHSRLEDRRRAQHITRRIQLLRAHRLVAKISHSQRYRVTQRGIRLMSAALYLGRHHWPQWIHRHAA